ncbi:MAG: hypothetical protein JW395_3607 [Nitrospira sp.]|nr:hypothetical protein [Nitrospira sp.]
MEVLHGIHQGSVEVPVSHQTLSQGGRVTNRGIEVPVGDQTGGRRKRGWLGATLERIDVSGGQGLRINSHIIHQPVQQSATTIVGTDHELIDVGGQESGAAAFEEELSIDVDLLGVTLLVEDVQAPGLPPTLVGVAGERVDTRLDALSRTIAATCRIEVDMIVAPRGMSLENSTLCG